MPLPDDFVHSASKPRRAIAALVIAIGVFLLWVPVYLPWLGMLDLLLEEPRRALIARTMMETGNYWVPQLGGEVYTAKPPLFNWLIAISAAMHGQLDEWSARFPAVISVALLALMMVGGARHWLRPWSLLFLGVSLVLAPEFLAKGRLAEIETLFSLLVAASLWSWFLLYRSGHDGWRLWVAPLLLVGLAYLAKREPAVVFFYFAVVPFLLLRGQWRLLLQRGHFIAGGCAVLLAGGWLVGVALQTGWGELWDSLQREVLERGLAEQGWRDVALHFVTYPFELLAAMLPFSLMLPLVAVPRLWRSASERFGDLWFFCALAIVVNLPIYWFRGDVSVRYFLPMFPFVLLMAAMLFEILLEESEIQQSWVKRYLRALYWIVLVLGAVLVALLLISMALPWFASDRVALLPWWLSIVLVAGAGGVLWWASRYAAYWRMPVMLLLFCVVALLGRALYFNLVLPDKVRRVAEEINAPLIAREVRHTVGSDTVVKARGLPWAVWYYSPSGSLEPLGEEVLSPGSWLLVSERWLEQAVALGFPRQERSRFVYKGEGLLLGQVPPPPQTDRTDQ